MPAGDEKRTYKIGEVCKVADVQPYVLRYWETEFPALAPNKSDGGQRMYSQREIDIILRIKQLLYSEGFTIAGAKKRLDIELEDGAVKPAAAAAARATKPEQAKGETSKTIANVRKELAAILKILEK
ncbi:MAG: MerR family transcriptional regulator [Thermoanaerobaculia bacterium]|nr:MerR family transcriptional regulator [Thermoanaerobaculia bacterium]